MWFWGKGKHREKKSKFGSYHPKSGNKWTKKEEKGNAEDLYTGRRKAEETQKGRNISKKRKSKLAQKKAAACSRQMGPGNGQSKMKSIVVATERGENQKKCEKGIGTKIRGTFNGGCRRRGGGRIKDGGKDN